VADQGLRGDRVGVERQREEEEQLQGDLVGAQLGGAGAGGHPGSHQERHLEHRGPQQEVPADDELGPDGGRAWPPGDVLADERPEEQARGQRLPGHVSHGRTDQAQPDGVHQQRAQHEAEQGPGQHVAHRTAELLHPAQPAVAGQRDQQQRGAEAGDAQPVLPGLGDLARPAGQHPGERTGEKLEEHEDDETQAERQPGGLHALGDGTGAVTGAGPAGRTRGRAVGEKVQQRGRPGQQPAADGEPAQGDGAEIPHDRCVDEQIERLGGENDERRKREGDDGRGALRDHDAGTTGTAGIVVRSP
jgi:hypothetical protein